MDVNKCQACNKPTILHLKYMGPLCKNCFTNIIEKRIRKDIRIKELFSKDDDIICIGELNRYFLDKILFSLPKKIKTVKSIPKKINKNSKIIIQSTMDDEINYFLENVILAKKMKKAKHITILSSVSDQELSYYTKFNDLKFVPNKKNKRVMGFVDKIYEKHAETKFSILNSIDEIKKVVKGSNKEF